MKKTVCLIGRPNVGKSTIFNKLIKEKKSIILDTPGVTRDRIYGDVSYEDKTFLLIDTGGIDLGEGDFNKDIKAQAEIAVRNRGNPLGTAPNRERGRNNHGTLSRGNERRQGAEAQSCQLMQYLHGQFFFTLIVWRPYGGRETLRVSPELIVMEAD